MSRSMPLVLTIILGIVLSAVGVPARGQGLLEAIGDAIDASMDDGDVHQHHNHDDYYPPNYPSTHYHKVWDGDHWDYVPHTNNVYPGNVVYPGATVVSPVTTNVVANALPYKGPGVTIALEEEVGGQVAYVIDGREPATIQAGQQQTLTSKGKYEIRFSRGRSADGRDFGQARYTVTEGNYHFEVTDKGWELLRDKEQPNIVTTQIQPASPAGIKTNALPPKPAPAAAPAPAATPPAAATAQPAKPAAVPAAVPAAAAVPANTIPPAPPAGG
ncbi:MAG: hypothetical protein ACKOZU_00180 [Planctomycetaceae bacterium]